MELDDSVVGLTGFKMQKVSTFRINANMLLAQQSRESMPIGQAVKYMHAAKFDEARADEIFKNYEKHRQTYNLDNLHTHRQRLNAEIRSKKLEILGARDPDGAQLLLFTAWKHDPKSCDFKTSMQLLFLILDQISESQETQTNGLTLIADLRDSSFAAYDFKYTSQMFSVLRDGYPLCLKMVYIVDAPVWFKGHALISSIHTTLQREGKVKMVSLPDLHKQLPEASLPPSLGGSLLPSRIVTATAGASAQELQAKSTNRKLPRAPPRNRTPVKQASLTELPINTVVSCDQHENEDSLQRQTGAVNRIKDLFEQKQEEIVPVRRMAQDQEKYPRHHPHPSPAPRLHPPHKPPARGGGSESSTNGRPKVLPPPPPTREKPAVSNRTALSRFGEKNEEMLAGAFSGRRKSADGKMFTKVTGKQDMEERKTQLGEAERRLSPTKQSFFGRGQGIHVAEETSSGKRTEDSSKKHGRFKVPFSVLNPGKEGSPPPAVKSTPSNTPLLSTQNSHDKAGKTTCYDDGYEPIEFKPITSLPSSSQQSPRHPTPPTSGPSQKSTPFSVPPSKPLPNTPSTLSTSCKQKVKQPLVCQDTPAESNPLPSGPSQPRAPRRRQYENVFLKQRPQGGGAGGDSDSDDEGDEELGDIGGEDKGIYENFGPDEGSRWMSALELQQYLSRKGKKGISAEYFKIKNEPLTGSHTVCRLSCNTKKNRYRDVVCFDETRVILSTQRGVEGSDYIHANYVNGYKKSRAFILTQGPMKRTVDDFWRMLWEQEVFVVVMTTKCVEMGKLKCAQYWPDGDGTATFGELSVQCTSFQMCEGYELRSLKVHCRGVTRLLMHYQFTAWPDYGVPSGGDAVLSLIYAAREMQGRYAEYVRDHHHHSLHGPPVVIHCSAGIGRSGTFCALDYCIDELREKGKVNVQQAVRHLRSQRAFAIQTDEQYEFCYKTVLEYALSLKTAMRT